MRITLLKIVELLTKLTPDIKFSNSIVDSEFEIASLFAPRDKSFYFFTGNKSFPKNIKESLVIVPNDFEKTDDSNIYVKLPKGFNPQLTYYRILSQLFSRKSSGIISKLSSINPKSIIGKNVQIDSFTHIEEDVIIGSNVIIGCNCKIHKGTIIENDVVIESGSVIGAQGVAWIWNEDQTEKIVQPQLGGVLVKRKSFLGAQTVIVRGSLNEKTIVGENTLMAPGCKLGHGTSIGDYSHFANNVTTGGNTQIGEYSFIGSGAIFRPKVKIHPKTIVGAGALVIKNTSTENKTLMGSPAREFETSKNPAGMPKPKK